MRPTLEQAEHAIKTGDGSGIRVAIIDSGVETGHPALQNITLSDDVVVTCDGISIQVHEGDGSDIYGHGTAVTGIIREEAPNAQIGSFRALDSTNRSRSLVVAECAMLAIQKGYDIINCSFGCRGLPRYLPEYKEWIDQAYVAGVQLVAASSNLDATTPEWPAYFPSVFGVRSTDCEADEFFHDPSEMISFIAKGERVSVPWKDGHEKIETGSSFAAPRITGKLARLLSSLPNTHRSELKPLMEQLAQPYSTYRI
ncbi:MAG: S8 family serine peptidase [Verrucomicrobiota bacterium]